MEARARDRLATPRRSGPPGVAGDVFDQLPEPVPSRPALSHAAFLCGSSELTPTHEPILGGPHCYACTNTAQIAQQRSVAMRLCVLVGLEWIPCSAVGSGIVGRSRTWPTRPALRRGTRLPTRCLRRARQSASMATLCQTTGRFQPVAMVERFTVLATPAWATNLAGAWIEHQPSRGRRQIAASPGDAKTSTVPLSSRCRHQRNLA